MVLPVDFCSSLSKMRLVQPSFDIETDTTMDFLKVERVRMRQYC